MTDYKLTDPYKEPCLSFPVSGMVFPVPEDFSFTECLAFLNRSNNECLHSIDGRILYKLLRIGEENVLLSISAGEADRRDGKALTVKRCNGTLNARILPGVCRYLTEWFDLDRDLQPFYRMGAADPVLRPLLERYRGLRLIGVPDLFEALSWAIIGQQINLSFAYTLKRRLVEAYGGSYVHNGTTYRLHPSPGQLAGRTVAELTELQLTRRKAEYLLGVAAAFQSGEVAKERLLHNTPAQIHDALTALRGIGPWTADYVIMKSFRCPTAFPVGDAGLQNAVRCRLGLPEKPTQAKLKELGRRWSGWEAYATFYLWRSLYE